MTTETEEDDLITTPPPIPWDTVRPYPPVGSGSRSLDDVFKDTSLESASHLRPMLRRLDIGCTQPSAAK